MKLAWNSRIAFALVLKEAVSLELAVYPGADRTCWLDGSRGAFSLGYGVAACVRVAPTGTGRIRISSVGSGKERWRLAATPAEAAKLAANLLVFGHFEVDAVEQLGGLA